MTVPPASHEHTYFQNLLAELTESNRSMKLQLDLLQRNLSLQEGTIGKAYAEARKAVATTMELREDLKVSSDLLLKRLSKQEEQIGRLESKSYPKSGFCCWNGGSAER